MGDDTMPIEAYSIVTDYMNRSSEERQHIYEMLNSVLEDKIRRLERKYKFLLGVCYNNLTCPKYAEIEDILYQIDKEEDERGRDN